VDALGGLDIFIHNASAMTGPGSGEEGWRQTLAVDILAGVVGAETALAALERSTAASVVFIGSTASMEFFNGPRPYGAGKAAMRTYAWELGEVWGRKGIRVNVVSLGSIDFPGSVWERVKASDPERYARAAHDAARTLRQCGRGSAGSGVCGESGGELDQRHERGRGRRPAQGGGLSQPRHALRALPPLRCSWTSPLSSSGTVMEPLPYLFGSYS